MAKSERVLLGSGKLYLVEYTGTIPEDTVIEVADNCIGEISGGCTITYTPTYVEAKGDSNRLIGRFLVDEEAVLKSGVLTWDKDVLGKVCATAKVETANGKAKVKIGGQANFEDKRYIVRFVHEDKVDGDLVCSIIGYSDAGLEFSFVKDSPVVVNAEFKAVGFEDGTMVELEERTAK